MRKEGDGKVEGPTSRKVAGTDTETEALTTVLVTRESRVIFHHSEMRMVKLERLSLAMVVA